MILKILPLLFDIFFTELVSAPYPYQTLKTSFSKTLPQKFKVNIYSYNANTVFSKYYFILISIEEFSRNRSFKFDKGMVQRKIR